MRHLRSWLIPALASSLALFAGCATEDAFSPARDDGSAVPRTAAVSAQTPFLTGELGTVELPSAAGQTLRGNDAMEYANHATSFMTDFAVERLNAAGTEELEASSVRFDDRGNVIMRFDQRINGLPVRGAQLVVEADAKTGAVSRINGQFVADAGLGDQPALAPGHALDTALLAAGIAVEQEFGTPELAYVLDPAGNAVLAWQTEVAYTNDEGPQRDIVFANADTGEMVIRHPIHKYARSLLTYSCSNTQCGTLVSSSSNTINTNDAAANAAHNYAIATYDYYWNNHGRDSIDDNGMTLRSRVHYGNNYNNAFWDGSQMTYGDGDGSTFIPLSQDADVVAHELTHGVTERSSNLIYSYESGALNEALSDIFGALVDRQEGANITDTWLLGEDIYTPGTPGDGLRVMNYPSSVGDFDYYPTRYTGSSDNGGVHWNSGIANLAFVLAVQGGSHPAGHNTGTVTPLNSNFDTSLQMAGDIFYAANTGCLGPSSNFQAARDCTTNAAQSIYGAAAAATITAAWDAVGVPGGGGGNPGSCDQPYSDSLSGLSGKRRAKSYFSQDVPSCASTVTISISGGSGDADLYVKFGSQPTLTSYDCRPYLAGNNETCTLPAQAGTYEIMIYGYSAYSGVTLTAQYQ